MSEPTAPASVPRKTRRPRFGLSLRALMVAVLVVGGVMGWKARRASIQRRAVAEITRAGGTVEYAHQMNTPGPMGFNPNAEPWAPAWLRRWTGDEYFQEPRDVLFFAGSTRPGGPSPDAIMAAVSALDGVETLDTIHYPITDVGLARLTALPRLKRLDIMDVEVTDAGLASLKAMPALEVFRTRVPRGKLGGSSLARLGELARLKQIEFIGLDPVAPGDLAPLANLRALERLRITWSPGDDSCLEHLRGLTSLVSIQMDQTRATDAGLARLAGLKNLDSLMLDGSAVTDAGLAHLAGLTKLGFLFLPGSSPSATGGITDAGLAHLAGLKGLSWLSLRCLKITDAGLDALAGLPLEGLHLSGLEATEAGLARLVAGRQFQDLGLSGAAITDAWLANLAGQTTRLRSLDLGQTRITDAGMASLAALPMLEILTLSGTAVTNAGLATLAQGAPRLRLVNCQGSKVNLLGVLKTKASRPGLTVIPGLGVFGK